MSGNDENQNPSNHGPHPLDTSMQNPYYPDGPIKVRGQSLSDSAYGSIPGSSTGPSDSQYPSPQSATSQGNPQLHSPQRENARHGSMAMPSLGTVEEASEATQAPSSPSLHVLQHALSQRDTDQSDLTLPPSEQHDTTSFSSQVRSALCNAIGSLSLTQSSSPPADIDPQHASSQSDISQAALDPPVSGRQEAPLDGSHATIPSRTSEEASDTSEASSYPSSQVDPQHPLSQNGVDETDFAPSTPVRQFEYSTVPAGLQNIRAQDMLHMNQDHGDSSGQPAGNSAPPIPPRHTRQASVDERSTSSGESPCDVCDAPEGSEYMSTFVPKPVRACRHPPLNLNGGRFWNPLIQQYEADVQEATTEETNRMPRAYSH